MQSSLVQENQEQKFRELYYHLYTNSAASRSERILSDLSKLIFSAIAFSDKEDRRVIDAFSQGKGSANSLLIPVLAKKFSGVVTLEDRFGLQDDELRHAFRLIQEIDLISSPSHTFGDAFQALMGPRLRGDKGQFFTPRSVVRALVEIIQPAAGERVIDPACGTGGFLSMVLDYWNRAGVGGSAIGIDKDADLALLASALSFVHNKLGKVTIHNANSLSIKDLKKKGIELESFDCVLTNPPFGAKIGVADRETLQQFELGHTWDRTEKGWSRTSVVRASQDPQVLFLELCVRLLKIGGRMAIVLPEGIFGNSNSGYVWDFLRAWGQVEALIDCPRTTFQPGTDTKTNILIFRRNEAKRHDKNCWIAVAYSCGHDKRGRSTKADGRPVIDDFSEIARDWLNPSHARELWSHVEIANPYYLVPRYYDQHLSDEVQLDAEKLGASITTLGDLEHAGEISIRKGHEVGSEAYGGGDIPFVRTSDLHNFEISYDPTISVSDEVYAQFRGQQNLRAGDLLMVVDGRYKIGRCSILHEWSMRCVVQSHLRIISTESMRFTPFALLYALSMKSVQREIRRLVFIQSTLGGLGKRIKEIRIPDPRNSHAWGEALTRFTHAITERSRHADYLRHYEYDVEL